MTRQTAFLVLLGSLLASVPAHAIEIFKGGNRAARKVTCVYDGDGIWIKGVKMRLKDIDAPEIQHHECARELQLGIRARDRLAQLMNGGFDVDYTRKKGFYGSELVYVILRDGRDAGQVLISEGLAQRWPNTGNVWCGRK
ncbi:thermonuclease family protein [Rhizobium sp. C1]|uniref:thermonuclease family protein n=1 Tax=Rhizobium sp. C1 TaxID=1349799 RepID=UPI001E4B6F4F|nr:thermonuclease family protein [Rhizobium sp. C1]MCD2177329.1 thermonuclease family protein [Rhizobium sp. C1]